MGFVAVSDVDVASSVDSRRLSARPSRSLVKRIFVDKVVIVSFTFTPVKFCLISSGLIRTAPAAGRRRPAGPRAHCTIGLQRFLKVRFQLRFRFLQQKAVIIINFSVISTLYR